MDMSTATDLVTDMPGDACNDEEFPFAVAGWDGFAVTDFGLASPGGGVGGGFLLSVAVYRGDFLLAGLPGLATLTDFVGDSSLAAPFFAAFLGDDRRVSIMGGLGLGLGRWLGQLLSEGLGTDALLLPTFSDLMLLEVAFFGMV
jgi:hypothetical protein